ncbi:MAG TPA: hypothetical protein VKC66_05010 [Xanthobacteraceae bacterium]|nr:hypothetical protein [Xanthobacteraceae bacterium]
MKVRVLDKPALEAVSPAALRAYLVYEGWKELEPFGEFSEVYTRSDGEPAGELVIPASTAIGDYASAVGQALHFLAAFENRDELAIYSDLVRADRDVIRVRAPDADNDGSISIDPGVELVSQARDMLASAACAALEPRSAYHLAKVQKAQDYMRRVRLGQTEEGSFVVTLLAPIPPILADSLQTSVWPHLEQEPFERRVTRMLTQSLHAARDAIVESNRGEGLKPFVGAVSRGVSANLCEALASIIKRSDGADVSVTWARTRPTPVPRDRIVFGRADGEVLTEAARQLRLREPRRDERVLGYVTDLHRAEDERRVTIKAIIDGRPRSLGIFLSEADYEIAVRANGRQAAVTLVGDLELDGQRWKLTDPREIRLMEGDDE